MLCTKNRATGGDESDRRLAAKTDRALRLRQIAFRLAAVLLGLSPFAAIEIGCILFDVGAKDVKSDPYVEFREIRPLFVPGEATGKFQTSPARLGYFCYQDFPVPKPTGEYRVFCLGGSTVHGRPYDDRTSFCRWLELSLQAAAPDRLWRVINCGGVSYASYRLVPILDEVLDFDPDLVVICTGHNEFLEDRTYGAAKRASPALIAAQDLASQLRSYNLLRELLHTVVEPSDKSISRFLFSTEVEARLDYRHGLEAYRRDLQWQQQVMAHYRVNLYRMIEMAGRARVPVLLVDPPSNLRDCPPFKSQHREELSEDQLRAWNLAWQEAEQQYKKSIPVALAKLQTALAIDDQHAGLHYQLGQCYDILGDWGNAKQHYLLAQDLDICPLRMLAPMHQDLHEVASRTNTPIIEALQLIASQCRGKIPDSSWMVDHVHPSIRGHQIIANAIAEWMMQQGILEGRPGWKQRREAVYAAHLKSLDELYFLHGERRLKALRDWAHGRATLVRPHDPSP